MYTHVMHCCLITVTVVGLQLTVDIILYCENLIQLVEYVTLGTEKKLKYI